VEFLATGKVIGFLYRYLSLPDEGGADAAMGIG